MESTLHLEGPPEVATAQLFAHMAQRARTRLDAIDSEMVSHMSAITLLRETLDHAVEQNMLSQSAAWRIVSRYALLLGWEGGDQRVSTPIPE